ncbi:hypothetical protein [Agarivorans sp. QJM3NY_33]|uniref:hypothetical protein n=1 Tax=Agarivorans sp. QJM3NY_33 TaxID=3421432 RepID=UPI003D7EE9E6
MMKHGLMLLHSSLDSLHLLLHLGGWVLSLLLGLSVLLANLLLERDRFRLISYPAQHKAYQTQLKGLEHRDQWLNLRCDMELKLNQHLNLIKTLISVSFIGLARHRLWHD